MCKFASSTSTVPGTASTRGSSRRGEPARASPARQPQLRANPPHPQLTQAEPRRPTRTASRRSSAVHQRLRHLAPRQHLLQRRHPDPSSQHRRHGVEPRQVQQPAALGMRHQHGRQLDRHAGRQPPFIVSPGVGGMGQPFGQGRPRDRRQGRQLVAFPFQRLDSSYCSSGFRTVLKSGSGLSIVALMATTFSVPRGDVPLAEVCSEHGQIAKD